jgi:quinol monooxygenase YgiN
MIEEKQMRAKARRVVQRMINVTLVHVFELWRDKSGEEKQTRVKSLKVVQRMLNATLVQVLEVWRDRTAVEKQMSVKARKVVHSLMNGALVSTFERWRGSNFHYCLLRWASFNNQTMYWCHNSYVSFEGSIIVLDLTRFCAETVEPQ